MSGFSGQENSKNKNFDIIQIPAIAIHVTNMCSKFRENRFNIFGENYNAVKKCVFEKNAFKFFFHEKS